MLIITRRYTRCKDFNLKTSYSLCTAFVSICVQTYPMHFTEIIVLLMWKFSLYFISFILLQHHAFVSWNAWNFNFNFLDLNCHPQRQMWKATWDWFSGARTKLFKKELNSKLHKINHNRCTIKTEIVRIKSIWSSTSVLNSIKSQSSFTSGSKQTQVMHEKLLISDVLLGCCSSSCQ